MNDFHLRCGNESQLAVLRLDIDYEIGNRFSADGSQREYRWLSLGANVVGNNTDFTLDIQTEHVGSARNGSSKLPIHVRQI